MPKPDALNLSSPRPNGLPFVKMLEQAEVVVQYRSALDAAVNTDEENPFTQEARKYVEAHRADPVCWMVPCIICRDLYEFWTTVEVSVDMRGAPRGICGKHDTGGDTATLIVG